MTEIAGKAVELRGIVKRFGAVTAVHRMDLSIDEGSFVTLLGPSGCGKTTTLRMIAGLLDPSEGEITIKGKSVTRTPIHKRNLGIVFQNYALFPHKTIYDNVAFGLKYRSQSQSDIDTKVRQALDLVQLPDLSNRFPRELSGGQQQRIALARAIVIEPDVLLLDEPLSALDANLREDMRVELKRIQAQLGITTIFVTHDQSEALAMSDKIVVMSKGHIEQIGDPEEVYVNPASAFVARFLGNSNLVEGKITARTGSDVNVAIGGFGSLKVPVGRSRDMADGERSMVVVRAERLYLDQSGADVPPDAISLPAEITAVDYQGQAARYFVAVGGKSLQAINPIETHPYRQGDKVRAVIRGRDCALVPFEANL
ncbi:ABC transporter ATP-binding protein [Agrobacterium sp. ES01]|uniref:ABC transporter ATP-binding protein n=1 Tax=Agrobacterium sp. ES01 TaxID=3420714 RepID=UPI003D146852